MKKFLMSMIALLLVFALIGCGAKAPEAAPAADDSLVIGYSLGDLNAAFFEAEKVEAERLAAELGIEIIIMGKIIGKQGKNAQAIRTLMKAAGAKTDKRIIVDIV